MTHLRRFVAIILGCVLVIPALPGIILTLLVLGLGLTLAGIGVLLGILVVAVFITGYSLLTPDGFLKDLRKILEEL